MRNQVKNEVTADSFLNDSYRSPKKSTNFSNNILSRSGSKIYKEHVKEVVTDQFVDLNGISHATTTVREVQREQIHKLVLKTPQNAGLFTKPKGVFSSHGVSYDNPINNGTFSSYNSPKRTVLYTPDKNVIANGPFKQKQTKKRRESAQNSPSTKLTKQKHSKSVSFEKSNGYVVQQVLFEPESAEAFLNKPAGVVLLLEDVSQPATERAPIPTTPGINLLRDLQLTAMDNSAPSKKNNISPENNAATAAGAQCARPSAIFIRNTTLVNEGNHCYANAMLQMLLHNKHIRECLFDNIADLRNWASFNPLSESKKCVISFCDLVDMFHTDNDAAVVARNSHSAATLIAAVCEYGTAKYGDNKHKICMATYNQQHDTIEFLQLLFQFFKNLPEFFSKFYGIFTFDVVESGYYCFNKCECGTADDGYCAPRVIESEKCNLMLFDFVALDRPKVTLSDCIANTFNAVEDMLTCPSCKKADTDVIRVLSTRFREDSLPPVLMFSLMRFDQEGERIPVEVSIPAVLVLNESGCVESTNSGSDRSSPPIKYQLQSLVFHSGCVAAGHYWTVSYCEMDRLWYKYNDNNCVECVGDISTNDDLLRSSEIYLAIYDKMTLIANDPDVDTTITDQHHDAPTAEQSTTHNTFLSSPLNTTTPNLVREDKYIQTSPVCADDFITDEDKDEANLFSLFNGDLVVRDVNDEDIAKLLCNIEEAEHLVIDTAYAKIESGDGTLSTAMGWCFAVFSTNIDPQTFAYDKVRYLLRYRGHVPSRSVVSMEPLYGHLYVVYQALLFVYFNAYEVACSNKTVYIHTQFEQPKVGCRSVFEDIISRYSLELYGHAILRVKELHDKLQQFVRIKLIYNAGADLHPGLVEQSSKGAGSANNIQEECSPIDRNSIVGPYFDQDFPDLPIVQDFHYDTVKFLEEPAMMRSFHNVRNLYGDVICAFRDSDEYLIPFNRRIHEFGTDVMSNSGFYHSRHPSQTANTSSTTAGGNISSSTNLDIIINGDSNNNSIIGDDGVNSAHNHNNSLDNETAANALISAFNNTTAIPVNNSATNLLSIPNSELGTADVSPHWFFETTVRFDVGFAKTKSKSMCDFGWAFSFSTDIVEIMDAQDNNTCFGMAGIDSHSAHPLGISCITEEDAQLQALGEILCFIVYHGEKFCQQAISIKCYSQHLVNIITGKTCSNSRRARMYSQIKAVYCNAKAVASEITFYVVQHESQSDILKNAAKQGSLSAVGSANGRHRIHRDIINPIILKHAVCSEIIDNNTTCDNTVVSLNTNDIPSTVHPIAVIKKHQFAIESKWTIKFKNLFTEAEFEQCSTGTQKFIECLKFDAFVLQRNTNKILFCTSLSAPIIFSLNDKQLQTVRKTSGAFADCTTHYSSTDFESFIGSTVSAVRAKWDIFLLAITVSKTFVPVHVWNTVHNREEGKHICDLNNNFRVSCVADVQLTLAELPCPSSPALINRIEQSNSAAAIVIDAISTPMSTRNITRQSSSTKATIKSKKQKELVDYKQQTPLCERGPASVSARKTTVKQNNRDLMGKDYKLVPPTGVQLTEQQTIAWSAVNQLDIEAIGQYQLVTDIEFYTVSYAHSVIFKQTIDLVNASAKYINPLAQQQVLKLCIVLPNMLFAKKHVKTPEQRIAAFIEYRWDELIDDMVDCFACDFVLPKKKQAQKYKGTKDYNHIDSIKLRINRHIRNGEVSKAHNALLSDMTTATASKSLVDLLLSKHPHRLPKNEISNNSDAETADVNTPAAAKFIRTDDMGRIIRTLSRGVSPGPDGLRFEHVSDMCRINAGLVKTIAQYCNLCATGCMPQWYYDKLAESVLISLAKKDELTGAISDTDIRPIAMGNVLRKLVSKSVQYVYRDDINLKLSPFQFGAGAKNGAEYIIHTVSASLDTHPDWFVLKIDYKNAFNTIYRKELLQKVEKYVPGMLPWVKVNHINKTKLWHKCGDNTKREYDYIWSEEGVQQGEVGGPTNFCIALQDVLVEVNSLIQSDLVMRARGGGLKLAYMDDVTLCAPLATIETIFPKIVELSAAVGLTVNLAKCKLFHNSLSVQSIANAVKLPVEIVRTGEGIIMAGVPIGNNQFCLKYWQKEFASISKDIDKSCEYSDKQVALQFLTKCVATRLNYFSRMTSPNSIASLSLSDYIDKSLCNGLCKLLQRNDVNVDDKCWLQARLSAKHGGLGIHSPKVNQPGAHLASLISCIKIIEKQIENNESNQNLSEFYCDTVLRPALKLLRENAKPVYDIIFNHSANGGEIQLESLDDLIASDAVKLQKKLTVHVSHDFYKQLWNASTVEDKLRLDSCAAEGSYLVTTLPVDSHLQIDSDCFVERLCMRLGLSIAGIDESKPCAKCGKVIDCGGYHFLSGCIGHNKIQFDATHNAVRDTWNAFARFCGYKCSIEQSDIIRRLGLDCNLRLDNKIENYEGGLTLYTDVTIVDPRTLRTLDNAPGAKALQSEINKLKKYEALVPEKESMKLCVLMPLVMERYGRWGKMARKVFKEMLQKAHEYTHEPKSYIAAKWRSRLCLTMHKQDAINMQSRIKSQLIASECSEVECERDCDLYLYSKSH